MDVQRSHNCRTRVGLTVDEFVAAQKELRLVKDEFLEEEQIWTQTHDFYAVVSGYVTTRERPRKPFSLWD
jgi:hypothetical protein